MAPQTDIPTVWDSYQNVVQNLRDKGLTEGITITSSYEDRNGESYETAWTANPLLLEGIGYSEYKGYEDQVQALEDQARTLERISESIDAVANRREEQESAEAARGQEKRDGQRYGGLGEDPIGTKSRWSAPEAGILVVARRSSRVLRGIFLASGCEEDGHLAYVFSPGIAPGHVVFQLA